MMKQSASLLIAAALGLATINGAHAHTTIRALNGQTQCLRPYRSNYDFNSPVTGNGDALMCNALGNSNPGVPACAVQAGTDVEVDFEWWPGTKFQADVYDQKAVIHPGHKGPCLAWIAEGFDVQPGQQKWAKIAEEGLVGNRFCTEIVNQNGGVWRFRIPAGLKPGDYLLRVELIAHHITNNPEHYVRCGHIRVEGDGNEVPTDLIAIPSNEYKNPNMVGFKYNLYSGNQGAYAAIGPQVAALAEDSRPAQQQQQQQQPQQQAAPAQQAQEEEETAAAAPAKEEENYVQADTKPAAAAAADTYKPAP
ncbi:hypothetical protein HK102_004265, partial [Quaeritorhiza haematococci]